MHCDYTRRFDQLEIAVIAIELPKSEWQLSLQRLQAAEKRWSRLRNGYAFTMKSSWRNHGSIPEPDGTVLGQKSPRLIGSGLVPGGSLLPFIRIDECIPAKVAGVKELIMVVPTPRGERNDEC